MTRYVYHITPYKNFESIKNNGIVPYEHKCKYGPMSPELYGKKKLKKIFLLQRIYGVGIKGFLEEWWHGDKKEIIVIRIDIKLIGTLHSSIDKYCAKHEHWCFNTIPIESCHWDFLITDQRNWKKFK